MNAKLSMVAAGLVALSTAASASTALSFNADNKASFSGVSGAEFTFVAQAGDILDTLTVTSNFISRSTVKEGTYTRTSGFDITEVWLDGVKVGVQNTIKSNPIKVGAAWTVTNYDNWTFSAHPLSGGTHTIKVVGLTSNAAQFSGNVQITPVPEPETYALMLAGLGAIGFVARRRKSA